MPRTDQYFMFCSRKITLILWSWSTASDTASLWLLCSSLLWFSAASGRITSTSGNSSAEKENYDFLWWNVSIKLMDKRLNLWDLFSSISFVTIFLLGSCSARATTSTSTCSRPSSSGVWLCSSKIQCCLQTKARITAPCPRWGCSTVWTRLLHIY